MKAVSLTIVLAAFSGLLLSAAWPPYSLTLTAWVALIPMVLAIQRAKSHWQATLCGFVSGGIWAFTTLDWVRTCGGGLAFWGPFSLVWACGLLGLTLTTVLICNIAFRLLAPAYLVIPVLWVLREQLFDLGLRQIAGTTADGFRLAITQVEVPILLQVADLGGAFLVSLVVAITNVAIAVFLSRPVNQNFSAKAAMQLSRCCAVFSLIYGTVQLNSSGDSIGPRVGVTSLKVEQFLHSSHSEDLSAIDVLLFPEAAIAGVFPLDSDVRDLVEQLQRLNVPSVICGVHRIDLQTAARFNSAMLIEPGSYKFADKRFLTPGFESNVQMFGTQLRKLQTAGFLSAASAPQRLIDTKGWDMGMGVCHDAVFHEWATELALQEKPDFLAIIGNEALDTTDFGSDALVNCASLRAVETRCAVARSIAHGRTNVVNSNGVSICECDASEDLVVCTVNRDPRRSVFVLYGTLFPWALTLILVGIIVAESTGKRRPQKST